EAGCRARQDDTRVVRGHQVRQLSDRVHRVVRLRPLLNGRHTDRAECARLCAMAKGTFYSIDRERRYRSRAKGELTVTGHVQAQGIAGSQIEPHHELGFLRRYIFSVDHKTIAKQYLSLSLFMAIAGGFTAYLIRWQLAWPETSVAGWGYVEPQAYNAIVTMHG